MKDSDELPSLQDEEQDDAVIGRALRGSIWVFAGLLFIGVMVWVIQKWPEKKGPGGNHRNIGADGNPESRGHCSKGEVYRSNPAKWDYLQTCQWGLWR